LPAYGPGRLTIAVFHFLEGVSLFITLQASRTALGRIDTKKHFLLRREHRLHALLHLLWRNVFLMRGHSPKMPKQSFELA
jgi:hypothetical protein